MKTFILHNAKYLLIMIASVVLGWSLATGEILNYITFTDVMGEMALFMIAIMMFMVSAVCIEFKTK